MPLQNRNQFACVGLEIGIFAVLGFSLKLNDRLLVVLNLVAHEVAVETVFP